MQHKMKKMWAAAAASLIATTSLVYADVDSAQMRNLENRVNALEQRKGAGGMINPPGRPQVRDGIDLFLFGDLLVWNAHENGLPVAVENSGSSNKLSINNLANSKVRTLHSEWDAGFRVGIGYNTPHDGWDMDLTWLRFYTHGSKRAHPGSNTIVYPTRVHPGDPTAAFGFCTKASSRWRLQINQLDLDLGREFFVSKWLTVRPHAGLRTDWIDQKWHNTYRNFPGIVPVPNKVKANYKDEWWGIGLEGGLDTQWGLGAGWSIFGNFATAIVYGFHELTFTDKDSPALAGETTSNGTFADVKNSYRISHPILDMMMGLRYDHMFFNDKFHLGLQVGWEHHIYFNQNQFPVFVDPIGTGTFVANQGDLALQGWTVGIRFDF